MKRLCGLIVVALIGAFSTQAQSTLTVTIQNLKNINGDILVGLYDNASNFPRKVATGKIVKVTEQVMRVTFPDLKPGNYAVSVLHDENQNKDMDQGTLGIPKEGYGFSNNAKAVMGPPSFKKARFNVPDGNTAITIKMKYLK